MPTFEGDPSGKRPNRISATATELTIMESLACDLQLTAPTELSRSYGSWGVDGAIIEFKTVQVEEPEHSIMRYGVKITHETQPEATFELLFGVDRELVDVYFPDKSQVERVEALADELLIFATLDPYEAAIVQRMRGLLGQREGRLGSASGLVTIDDARCHTVDIVKRLIKDARPLTFQRQERGHAFDLEHSLVVVEYSIPNPSDELDLQDLSSQLSLEVEYENRITSSHYYYAKTFSGEAVLEVYDPAKLLQRQRNQIASPVRNPEGILAAELQQVLGASLPSRFGVKFLTQRIIEATMEQEQRDSHSLERLENFLASIAFA